MSTLDYGTGVSRTLQPEFHGFDTIVFQDGKPVLDSELNLLFDVVSDKFQKYISNQAQSGFLNVPSFVFDVTWPNKFQMPQDIAIVNGHQINVLSHGDSFIELNPASLGSGNNRYDFLFLEVWKVELSGGTTDYKPDATHIYKEGNVQNTLSTLDDDIIDPIIVATYPETTKRVQIQYRIRIQENDPSFILNSQNSNIFDSITYAQGGALVPVNPFNFSNLGASTGDYGLWRAGNGDASSRLQLKSVDGYVYAIPIALVFRRSQAPYIDEDINGQQASDVAIGGTSDRPDGLFYDSVASADVIDLRHNVVFGKQITYDEILKTAIKDLLTGQNKTKRQIAVKYDALSDIAITGYSIVGAADKTRTTISDLQTTIVSNVVRLNVGDTDPSQDFYTSRAAGNWQIGDTITVKAPAGSPAGTIILGTDDASVSTKPFVYRNNAGLINVAGSWLNTGTATAIFTINENITAQEIWVTYDVQYPNNQGMSYIADDVIKVDYTNAASFPTVQTSYVPHSGIVRASTNLANTSLYLSRHSKQLNFTHAATINSYAANYQFTKHNKQISITPIISSTTTINGSTRTLFTNNTSATTRELYLPFATNKTWMVRGVYTTQSGTTEIATEVFASQNPSLISGHVFKHPTAVTQYSFAKITSMVYVPTSTELVSTGAWSPVYKQSSNGNIDLFVLVNSSGVEYVPPSSNTADFVMAYRSIPTNRVNAYVASSVAPIDNWIKVRDDATIIDGQQLWVDMDYIGEPHDGAQVKIAYKYLPYQGLVDTSSGLQLDAIIKALGGFIHSDGTGNVTANIDLKTYPRTLISYLPTPLNIEYLLKGDSITGVTSLGKYNSNDVCHVDTSLLEYATTDQSMLKIDDIITARFNVALNAIERGGNEATALKSIMLLPLAVANYKQVVIFGLAITTNNFAFKNELILYVWTYTNNNTANQLTSADATHIGVDFYFINKRPLVK